MNLLIKALLIVLLTLGLGALAVVLLIVEDEPRVPVYGELSPSDLQQVKQFIATSDPRALSAGDISAISITEQDLQLLLNYLLQNLKGGSSRVEMTDGLALVDISIRLPENVLGDYLNVKFSMARWADALVMEKLQIGRLHVPGWFADAVMKFAHEELKRQSPEYVAALAAVNDYTISHNELNVIYQWQPELLEQLSNRGRELLISREESDRLTAHAHNLSAVTRNPDLPRSVSLAALMRPVFEFAHTRQGDPVAENRAAIITMAMYVMGINVTKVLGDAADDIPPMGRYRLTLSGRLDFAQHFLVSAGLTVSAGTSIADAIGLLKEMDDSEFGGSGFSFTDIGADRAGVRFAELATAGPEQAIAVQRLLSGDVEEADFMPDFSDLPEFMGQHAFQREFGEVGSPAYNDLMEKIEGRISALVLFSGGE